MHIRSADGTRLELHDFGGAGRPLLIVHATGFCAGAYRPMAAELAGSFRLWGLDVRGHGQSDARPDGDMNWGGIAADVRAAAAAIDAGPVVGFGHSLGGGVILQAELLSPGTFSAAYLYEPIVFPAGYEPPPAEANPMAAAARRRRATFGSRGEVLLRYASRPPLGELRADALAAYVEHGFVELPDGSVTLRCPPEREADTFAAEGRLTTEQLTGLALPSVLAYGRRGVLSRPRSFIPAIHAAMPKSESREFAHLGHFGPLQDPAYVAEDLLARL